MRRFKNLLAGRDERSARGSTLGGRAVAWLPVLISMLFTALALLPELRPTANLNDDAFHFLLIQEAKDALNRGANVLDFWSPVLELGLPPFLYYQNLPHLFVVLVDQLTMGRVDLITSFNAVRYLLLVGFPLTVYWSLTRMGFARQGSALAAALAPLFSGNFSYGFEYDSYLWSGWGMYTQLWAMHLSFIALALLADYLERGRNLVLAVAALSALILSHLLYAYMLAISAGFLLVVGMSAASARTRTLRFALAWGTSALVTAYFWLPFLAARVYFSVSPYLQPWKYDSFGARAILSRLVTGDLFDHARLPVITALVAIGFVTALLIRSRQALLAAGLFILWLCLYFGRATWGSLADLLPLHDGLIMHRFIGGVGIAALMLVAVAGACLWQFLSRWNVAWRTPAFAVLGVALTLPALLERHRFHERNDVFMTRTESALARTPEAREIIARLKTLPPGRTFAGLRADWGREMKLGDLSFSDLLTLDRVAAVSPPNQSFSLNSDLLWDFDYRNRDDYELFNVRYVVAPSGEPMPGFLGILERRGRYVLYEARTGGYFSIGRSDIALSGRQSDFLPAARSWRASAMPAAGEFPQVRLAGAAPAARDLPSYPLSEARGLWPALAARPRPKGMVIDERIAPQRYAADVELQEEATVILKVSYHPNWRATVDGLQVPTAMVMPSYIGITLPAGRHGVSVEYQSDGRRTLLLCIGAAVMILAAALAGYRKWVVGRPLA